jgi:hypothetical protein
LSRPGTTVSDPRSASVAWGAPINERTEEGSVKKVVVSMNVALDGVMEAPERWSFQYWSEELSESAHEELLGSGALLLGRLNYEAFAAFWPTAHERAGHRGEDEWPAKVRGFDDPGGAPGVGELYAHTW